MRTLTVLDDLANVDWLYVAELYGLIVFAILTVMVAATVLFWARSPRDLGL